MASPYRVLKAAMWASWVHKAISPQLLDVAKALELRSVNDLHQKWMQSDVAMNRVVEHFLHGELSILK